MIDAFVQSRQKDNESKRHTSRPRARLIIWCLPLLGDGESFGPVNGSLIFQICLVPDNDYWHRLIILDSDDFFT